MTSSLIPSLPSIPAYLEFWSEQTPQAPALFVWRHAGPPLILSYRQLAEAVSLMTRRLVEQGLSAGDRMAIFCNLDERLFITLLAASTIGAVAAPVVADSASSHDVVESYHSCFPLKLICRTGHFHRFANKIFRGSTRPPVLSLDDADSSSFFNSEVLTDWKNRVQGCDGSRPFYLNHTSGSTSRPKLTEPSHRQLIDNAHVCASRLRMDQASRLLCLFRYHQHEHFLRPLLVGGCASLLPFGFTEISLARFCAGATHLLTNPFSAQFLSAEDPSKLAPLRGRLKIIEIGGGIVPDSVSRGLELHTGAKVLVAYGSTETSGAALLTSGRGVSGKNCLRPLPGYTCQIVNEKGDIAPPGEPGELVIQGPSVVPAYLIQPPGELRLAVGHFHTKDLAVQDTDGIRVLGRLDNCIKMLASRQPLEAIEQELSRALDSVATAVQCLDIEPQNSGQMLQFGCSILALILPSPQLRSHPAKARELISRALRTARLQTSLTAPSCFLIAEKGEIRFESGKLHRRTARNHFPFAISDWPPAARSRLVDAPRPFHQTLRTLARLVRERKSVRHPLRGLIRIARRATLMHGRNIAIRLSRSF